MGLLASSAYFQNEYILFRVISFAHTIYTVISLLSLSGGHCCENGRHYLINTVICERAYFISKLVTFSVFCFARSHCYVLQMTDGYFSSHLFPFSSIFLFFLFHRF